MHSFAFSCLQLVQEDPAQLGNLRGVLGRAAKLGRDLLDRLRRDGAVLVAQVGVLRLVYVWTTSPAHLCAFVRICAHSNAFKCIVVHSHAS